jgi:Flp pilus assembly protein TadD/uncharacterized protein (AIM24 family)
VARRLAGDDQVEGQDEEFLFHLNRGSDQLGAGQLDGARGTLERALELRPRDAKVLGLLGQVCYRQGKYEDAIVAWQRLVDENPAEPAARVNLGLALLRAQRYGQATRQLEIALDLNPDHKKAMGYLGLALLESGDPAGAREWFKRAGSDQMVARCDEALAGRPVAQLSAAEPAPAPEEAAPTPPPGQPFGRPVAAPAPTVEAEAALAAARPDPVQGRAPGEFPELAAWAAAHQVAMVGDSTFSVSRGVLVVRIGSVVRTRLEGLIAVSGDVQAHPEVMRFRGKPTERAFGEGAGRLHVAAGEGVLLVATAGRRFTPVALGDEAAYFREEVVFGFEEAVVYENGRVPSAGAGELRLVHLRGAGAVLLSTAGEPVAVDVLPGVPLRVPVAALVGWLGGLTPRLGNGLLGGAAGAVVELAGEGRALVDPAAGEG